VRTRRYIEISLTVAILGLVGIATIAAKGGQEIDKGDERLSLKVATIDGKPITLGYVESAALKQSPIVRKGLADPEKRREFLDKLINMEVLAAEAEKRGFADHAEVKSVRKNQLASLMHKKIADDIAEEEPTEEQMRAYYEEHSDSYNKPEKMRARHILIKDEDAAEKLLAEILEKKPSQYEFRRMAQEKSADEPTRLRGGDLTFFPRIEDRKDGDPEIPAPLVEAVFSLKENGDIYSKLIKSEEGFHIVMRTGHRDAMNLSFEDAKERLALLVKRENRKNAVENAIDALKKRFEVTLHEENLKDVVIDLTGGPPKPGIKGGLTPQERNKLKAALDSADKE